MGFIITLLKWVILVAAAYYVFKIVRTLIKEPNLRLYLVQDGQGGEEHVLSVPCLSPRRIGI